MVIILKLSNIFRRIAKNLNDFAKWIDYKSYDLSFYKFTDCFETIHVLSQYIKPRILCDIGAHTGDWTYIMHKVNPQLKHVVLFEPQKKLHKSLNCILLPGVQKVIYPFALGDKEESNIIKGGTASASILHATSNQDYFFQEV